MTTTHRTFYLVPADVVAQPTVAIPRPLAPSPRIIPSVRAAPKAMPGPAKRSLSNDPIEALLGEPQQPHQRKRECLDHLTHEQKLHRRKMKNRIAAQTARDRKKFRSQRLEDVIRELLEQNQVLKQENDLLRNENSELAEQNRSLIARLESTSNDAICPSVSTRPSVPAELDHNQHKKKGTGCPILSRAPTYGQPLGGGLLQSEELEKILNDFSEEDLNFDLDHLVGQLQDGNSVLQRTSSVQLCQPDCSSSSSTSSVDESIVNVPRCSPYSGAFPSPTNYSSQMDEITLFEEQKLIDDPMLSSPSSFLSDSPNHHALSPFSESFQREFFQMLE